MNNPRKAQTKSSETDRRKEAIDWLNKYGDDLLAYAAARVRSIDVAEELVQETFLAAIQTYDTFRRDSSVKTWLIAILRRKVVDHYREQNRRQRHAEEKQQAEEVFFKRGHLTNISSWPKGPANELENQEFWDVFDECLSKLTPSIAEAFVLRTMDELTTEKVCNILGVNATNLSVRLHRARLSLRWCLEKNWFREK